MANRNPSPPSPVLLALAGALSLAAAMGIGRFAFTPLLPPMIAAGQLDVAAGGWIAAGNYAGYLLGAMTAARVPLPASRLGLLALLMTALLTAAMALPGPFALWLGLRVAAGVCSAWAFVATSVWCLAALGQAGRPQLASAVYAGVGTGIAVTGLYCLAAGAAQLSPAAMWLELAALALAIAAAVGWISRTQGGQARRATTPPPAMPPGTRGLVVSYGLLGFGYILPATFLPVLARDVVSDPRLFGLAWPVFGATAAVSTLLAAGALRRFSRLQLWAACNLLMGLGALLPALRPTAWTIALSALLVGGTFMVVTLLGVQEIRARAVGDPTALVGRLTAAFALGQIAGPVVSSLLLQWPALRAQALGIALQAAALALFASAAWLWRQTQSASISNQEPSHAR